ncbi:MAG: hypothetical protein V1806_05550 [Pseudomonadota bacterium]
MANGTPSQRSYLASWLTAALFFHVLLAGSALTMWLRPQTFYWRAWEYFSDVVYRNQSVAPIWEDLEKGDRSRGFYFLYQEAHPTRVTTDQEGFRSVPIPSPAYPVVVVGDSTIFGSGLSDDETLPWLLARELGVPIFNGARTTFDNALANPRLARVRLVIEGRTEAALGGLEVREGLGDGTYTPLRQGDLGVLHSAPLALYFWPARLLRDIERVGHDVGYLRKHRDRMEPRLFKRHRYKPADLERAVKVVQATQRLLQARGITYVFLPVPSAQTLYAADVDPFTRVFISRLTQRLRQEGIHTLDLTVPFQAHKGQGLFLNTDTHWNGKGSRLAARELATYLRGAGLTPDLAPSAASAATASGD